MPNHKPIFTCVGVAKLAGPDMRVEIEVAAYDAEGAALEASKATANVAA